MSMSDFATPAPAGGSTDYHALNGHLLIFDVTEVVKDVKTVNGLRDAVRATITDIDTGDVNEDTLIFPKVLKSQLTSRVGKKVLGRLGQGAAKPSQSPPWVLAEATPDDYETAGKYLASQITAADI